MTVSALKNRSNKTEIFSLLKQYGSFPLAYHTLQPDLEYYQTDTGYIAYVRFGKDIIVLGDPVVSIKNKGELLQSFITTHKHVSFIHISSQTAFILHQFGFSSTHFGYESRLSLPFSLQGKLKKDVRLLFNAARKSDITVNEVFDRNCISRATAILIAGRNSHDSFSDQTEFSFLSRPFQNRYEEGVRIFAAFQNEQIIGYSLFDPIYTNGIINDYSEAIIRRRPDAPKGTRTFILIKAMEQFKRENIRSVNLGLLPFFPPENNIYRHQGNAAASLIFSGLYHSSPLIHNFRGISFHKTRYRGKLSPVYFATPKKIPVVQLLKIHKLTSGRYFSLNV